MSSSGCYARVFVTSLIKLSGLADAQADSDEAQADSDEAAPNALRILAGQCDEQRPSGLYVHFPFCGARCPYCDFAIDVRPEIPHDRYAQAVCAEIVARAPHFRTASPPVSAYFGGGTPGLWRPDCIASVLATAARAFAIPDLSALEITVEANPGEVTELHLAALRAVGVNRLSFGIQSFDDALLREIGRTHTVAHAQAAIPLARAVGFSNIACDLMFGLPGQTLLQWQQTLRLAAAAGPDHLSCYALTIEPFTPFGQREKKGQLSRPDDDAVAEMWDVAQATLATAGFEHYEVSSYAQPLARAVHNSLYWTQAAYLGVGCAAASFRPMAGGGGWRFINPRSAESYMRGSLSASGEVAAAQVEWRSSDDLEGEALWLALRTSDGLDRARHRELFGADPLHSATRNQTAQALQRAGWLTISPAYLRPTPAGLLFADEMASRLWA